MNGSMLQRLRTTMDAAQQLPEQVGKSTYLMRDAATALNKTLFTMTFVLLAILTVLTIQLVKS